MRTGVAEEEDWQADGDEKYTKLPLPPLSRHPCRLCERAHQVAGGVAPYIEQR